MKLLHFESIIDHVNWLFFLQRRGKMPAFALCWNILKLKKAFRYYIKQIDSMLPCVWFSNRSQETSKCGKNISDTLGYASCATFLFLPHFDVICDLLLNRRTATWNLFVLYNNKKPFLFQNISTERESRPYAPPFAPPVHEKKPFDVIFDLFKMKQFHWLLYVAKNCDWSRKIAPLSNLTRASLLTE